MIPENQMRKRTWCHLLLLTVFFPLAVFFVTLASFSKVDALKENDDGGFQWADAQDSLESCTYEQLEAAFGTKDDPLSLQDEGKCWKLTDRILRVPPSAILNFNSLVLLGHGNKGGVFLVFLSLSETQPPCKAVYKTDMANTNLCADVWTHPMSASWSRIRSCLSAHLNPFGSSLPGELTGGVVFQAIRQYTADHPQDPWDTRGILPIWAMVPMHTSEHQDGDKHHSSLRKHHRHRHGDYPGVMGTIMPYKEFVSLRPNTVHRYTASQLASLLYTAAQGLSFVHQLGLAHQDLVPKAYKNVGLVKSPGGGGGFSHSILFDWGYTALDDNPPSDSDETCSLGRACDFCIQSYFPSPRVGGDHGAKHSRRRTLDCDNLRTMIATLWSGHVQDASTEGQYWQSQMQDQVDCSRSTQELADFLALAAKGRSG